MTRRIYLDLDGVMADFDGSFPAVFGLDHRSMADDDMWLKINGHPTFFRDLPPMVGAVDFFRSIEHLEPIILTACPKSNYAHVATQKVEWVRAHLSAHVTVLPVLGGSSKPLFMHAKGDILIDDFRRNTEAWAAAGGHAILHRGFEGTAAALEAAIGPYATQPAEQPKPEGGEAVAEVYDWREDDGTSKRCVSFLCPISELPVGTKLYAAQPKPEQAVGDGVGMRREVALDFADNPRPYHTLQAPADTNGELYRALAVLAAAYRKAVNARPAVATPAEVTGASYADDPDFPATDRAMLNYLASAFDSETWVCERCGHEEDTKTMDSASMLRDYLAAHPEPASPCAGVGVPDGWKLVPVKATREITEAGRKSLIESSKANVSYDTTAAYAYDDMIAAAPVSNLETFVGVPDVVTEVVAEVVRAMAKFPTWPTDPLHALGVVGEEFGELGKAVLQQVYEPHKNQPDDIRKEAVQTAAMALRFVASLGKYQFAPGVQHQQPMLAAAPEVPRG
jgi:hypothetical protein